MKTPSPPRQDNAKTPNDKRPGGNLESDSSGVAAERPGEAFGEAALLGADWFWEMDAELRYTFQSSGFEEITGIADTEVIGKTRAEAFAGRVEDSEDWRRQAEVTARNGVEPPRGKEAPIFLRRKWLAADGGT